MKKLACLFVASFALSPKGAPVGTVDVYVDGKKIETINLGDAQ